MSPSVPKTTHHSGPKDYRPMAPYITHHEDPGETHPGPATAHGQPSNAGVPNPQSPDQYQSVDYLVASHKENNMALSSKDDGTGDGKPTQDGSEEHSESEEEQVRQRVPKVDKIKTAEFPALQQWMIVSFSLNASTLLESVHPKGAKYIFVFSKIRWPADLKITGQVMEKPDKMNAKTIEKRKMCCRKSCSISSLGSAFDLFRTEEMIQLLCTHTKLHGR